MKNNTVAPAWIPTLWSGYIGRPDRGGNHWQQGVDKLKYILIFWSNNVKQRKSQESGLRMQ
jgi:hypothetical protein